LHLCASLTSHTRFKGLKSFPRTRRFPFTVRANTLTFARVLTFILLARLRHSSLLNAQALTNLAPRLRMTSLYAVAAAEGLLVAGTGNRSEIYMGYFTKWGDGACDFNPISDLTATEVFEFLDYLGAPRCIIDKAPSAGLYEGQTDEQDMGVSYAAIDRYITTGEATDKEREIIDRYHAVSAHKRRPYSRYK